MEICPMYIHSISMTFSTPTTPLTAVTPAATAAQPGATCSVRTGQQQLCSRLQCTAAQWCPLQPSSPPHTRLQAAGKELRLVCTVQRARLDCLYSCGYLPSDQSVQHFPG